jgi:hypothetical protein
MRSSFVRAFIALTVAGSAAVAGTSTVAGVTSTVSWLVSTSAIPVTGTARPYVMSLSTFKSGAFSSSTIDLSRGGTTVSDPIQAHDFTVSHVAVACTAGIASCTVNAGTHMNGFGHMKMTFRPLHPAKTTEFRCTANHNLLSRTISRDGTLGGSFELDTATSYFGNITNGTHTHVHVPASWGAFVSRTESFNNPCPPPPPGPCTARGISLSASGGNYASIWASRAMPGRTASLYLSIPSTSTNPDVTVAHGVLGSGPASALQITPHTPTAMEKATLDISGKSPFATGHGTFTANGPIVHLGTPTCIYDTRPGTIAGNFTAHLDGWGAMRFPAANTATLASYHPAH